MVAGEHVVLPSPRVPDSPMEPTDPIIDPLVHLAYVAAVTERLELGTGIIIPPYAIHSFSQLTCLADAAHCC
jgi:alkanesulfonate monooxygenase SsuD/methylene tetrahydromethanopterin reductase-like flavin-dependent oxidoreductase (luciferase family)